MEDKQHQEHNENPKRQERHRLDDLRKWELVEINEQLHQSIEDIQKAREQLAYTNRRLSEDNAALRQESGDLRVTNQKLHLAVQELGTENISLLEANLHLANKNQNLTQQIALCASSMDSCPREPKPSTLKRLRAWIRTEKV